MFQHIIVLVTVKVRMSKDFWCTYYCVLLNLKQETNSWRHSNSISVGFRLKQGLITVIILPVFCGCPQPAAHRRGVTAPAAMLVLCRTALDVSTSFQTLTPVFQCLHGAVPSAISDTSCSPPRLCQTAVRTGDTSSFSSSMI